MTKYKVFVTGTLDYDFEVEAEDKWGAEHLGEAAFEKEFGNIMWSGIQADYIEELEDA